MEQKNSRPLQQQLQYALPVPLMRSAGLLTPAKNPGLILQALARTQARQQQSEL